MTTTASVSATIRNHPQALAESNTFAEFCDKLGHTWIKDIEWAARVFDTIKFNPHCDGSYKPLYAPRARTFSDLFEVARFAPNRPQGFHYLGSTNAGDAAFCGSFGGKRYVKQFRDGTACRGYGSGNSFYHTWVKPRPETVDLVYPHLIGKVGSFEAVKRSDDSILVTVRDEFGIGERWLAVFDPGVTVKDIMIPEDRAFLEKGIADKERDWACVRKGEDGREYLDKSKCAIEVRYG